MITFLPQQNVALLSPWFDHYYANGKQAYLQQIMTIFFSKISTLLLRWYNLEMRQLRLRHDIKVRKLSMSSTKYFSSQGLYLYDLHTDEQMLVYRPDTVTMDCEFTKASTIAARLEVWIL